jgi:nucleoside triphosphate pyrophosphatase
MLILASASPRRQELLRNAGVEFVVQPSDIPEVPLPGEAPQVFAERVAREKARTVYQRNLGEFVLAADTVVIVDDQILNKPENAQDAARMLRLLSGRSHLVTTAVCLMGRPAETINLHDYFYDERSETTRVTFTFLSEADIAAYIASGEPMDKAGAYGIQGLASRWIPRVEGCYFNVVGLPVALVYSMLREHGLVT